MLYEALQDNVYQVMTIWVVVTDGERIRVLEVVEENETPPEGNISNLIEANRDNLALDGVFAPGVQELVQAESVLINDEPVVADFIKAINTQLEQAQRLCLFDHLIVVAPSGILGVLIDNLTTEVHEPLMLELETDLIDDEAAVIRASLPV